MPAKGQYGYSPEELEVAFAKAMDYCTSEKEPPVNYVLHRFTSISDDTMERYVNRAAKMAAGEEETDPVIMRCAEVIKKWQEFKTYWWVALGVSNEKLQTMAIFNLKQPCNGGYTDKAPTNTGGTEVTIKLQGVGDKAFG